MTLIKLEVSGMSCGHCLNAVKTALTELDGVSVTSVAIGSATAEIDSALRTPEDLVAAIREAGYDATVGDA